MTSALGSNHARTRRLTLQGIGKHLRSHPDRRWMPDFTEPAEPRCFVLLQIHCNSSWHGVQDVVQPSWQGFVWKDDALAYPLVWFARLFELLRQVLCCEECAGNCRDPRSSAKDGVIILLKVPGLWDFLAAHATPMLLIPDFFKCEGRGIFVSNMLSTWADFERLHSMNLVLPFLI